FTASGTSYFRTEGNDLKGKIFKTIDRFFDTEEPLFQLVDASKQISIHLIFYIAAEEAIDKISSIESLISEQEKYKNLNFAIHVLQKIDSSLKEDILQNQRDFIELSEKYVDDSFVDGHWKKAKHEKYYLGYNECALPIVLAHNTPNNSL